MISFSNFINVATVIWLLSYMLWDIQTKLGLKENLITDEELRSYNGIDRPKLYLSILGNVFDVTKGAQHYGPGAAYNMFVGRDNSKGFQTGKMHDDDDDNNISFELADLRTLEYWIKFYKKQYISKGKLIGKYYDSNGNLTPYGEQVHLELKRVKDAEIIEENNKLIFPSCNVEWSPYSFTKVWCTKNSGGVKRDWVGVPRRLFDVEKNTERCACIGECNRDLGMYEEYDDCNSESDSCYIALPV